MLCILVILKSLRRFIYLFVSINIIILVSVDRNPSHKIDCGHLLVLGL